MSDVKLATVLDVAKHPEFCESELNRLYRLFCKYATPSTKKGSMQVSGMKQLLQDLDLAQTHLEAKLTYEKYCKEGGALSLDPFMKLVKDLTAKNGTISLEAILKFAVQDEVSVDDVGVGGAKRFFEAKAKVLEVGDAAYRAFEDRKKEEEEKKMKKEEFKKKMEHFNQPPAPAQSQPHTQPKPLAQIKPQPEVQTEVQPKPEVEPETQAEVQPQSEPQVQPEPQAQPEPQVQVQAEVQVQSEVQVEAQIQVQPHPVLAQVQPQMQQQAQAAAI